MSRTARLLEAWGRALHAHRGLCSAAVLLVSAALIGLAGYRVQRFGVPVDFTPQSLFIDEGEAVNDLRRVQSTFGRDDNDLLLLVEGPLASEPGAAYLRALQLSQNCPPELVPAAVKAQIK